MYIHIYIYVYICGEIHVTIYVCVCASNVLEISPTALFQIRSSEASPQRKTATLSRHFEAHLNNYALICLVPFRELNESCET